eukprot:TRINITY_DN7065_c0_g1_i1.p1 TRINITY_DN7065_c0_g1~~TRINITY_DN7065_c0_g1_i1.p1  ORF type:complete len:364 (+),score=54.34 TRINITY_DN7065_c0_g1_i1:37-1128(+)
MEEQSITWFASASGDATVKLWKADEAVNDDVKRSDKEHPEYVLAHTLTGHQHKVTCVAFDVSKELVATGSADKTVMLWKTETGTLHATMDDFKDGPLCLEFDTTGEMLAVAGWDTTIQLRKVDCGAVCATLKGHTSAVNAVAFSPNGQTMASASRDGTVRLWKVGAGEVSSQATAVLERHSGVVTCVAFSHDGNLLASGGHDTRVLVWETAALSGVSRPQVSDLEGSPGPNGSMASCHSLLQHTEYVLEVAFPRFTNRLLASASADKSILLWSTETFELISTCSGHTGPVNSIAFSSDSTMLVSGSRDRTIRLWAIASREVQPRLLGHSGPCVLAGGWGRAMVLGMCLETGMFFTPCICLRNW